MDDDTKQTYNNVIMSVPLEHPLTCGNFNNNGIITTVLGKCMKLKKRMSADLKDSTHKNFIKASYCL